MTSGSLGSVLRLELQWASQANCTQRRGRTGRVCDGTYYQLVPREFSRHSFSGYAKSEFLVLPLHDIVLKLKRLPTRSHPAQLLALLPDAPLANDLERAILMLKQLGALSMSRDGASASISVDDGVLTGLGRLMASLPIDAQLARLIAISHCFGVLEEGIIVAAGLSTSHLFATRHEDEAAGYLARLYFDDGRFSDALLVLRLYREFVRAGYRAPRDEGDAVTGHWSTVQVRRLLEMDSLVDEIRLRLGLKRDGEKLAALGRCDDVAQRIELDDEAFSLLVKV